MRKHILSLSVAFASTVIAAPLWAGESGDPLMISAPQQEQSNALLLTTINEMQNKISVLEERSAEQMQAIAATAEALEGQESPQAKVHLGGYGELHYNNLSGEGGAEDKKEVDFHRFVLMFAYDFNDDIRFFSEFELEHAIAGEEQKGEIELEQAFIDFAINERVTSRGGVFLIPVGLINETHEPTTFYGVERNPVEKNIIPATWWEAGAGIYGEIAQGWRYDLYAHSGLNTNSDKKYAVRSGRQKVSKAQADDLAYTGRLRYTAIPGLELAATVQYQTDMTQGQDNTAGSGVLSETHLAYMVGDFALKALYARWDLDGQGPEEKGSDLQLGWYIEPAYRISEQFGVFARYNRWDNQAGAADIASEKTQTDFGINWWPHPDVVLKADYQIQDNNNDSNQNGINLAMGYQF